MTIIGIFGKPRIGKTLYMTYLLKKENVKQNNKKFFTNYKVSFPHSYINKTFMENYIQKNVILTDAVLGIDELHTFIDSRQSMREKNRIASYFILQTGKNNIDLIYTTHFLHMVDKRLRGVTEFFCEPKYILKKDIIKVKIIDVFNNKSKTKIIKNASQYFNLYDTKEIINLED